MYRPGFNSVERVIFGGNEYKPVDMKKVREQINENWRRKVVFPIKEVYSSFTMATWIETLEKASRAAEDKEKIKEKKKVAEDYEQSKKERKENAEEWEWVWEKHQELFPKTHGRVKEAEIKAKLIEIEAEEKKIAGKAEADFNDDDRKVTEKIEALKTEIKELENEGKKVENI